MPITYSADRFTVTGGKVSATATSATATTLTASGAFTAWTTETLVDRAIWIHTGTGAGQFRNIVTRDSNDTVTIDEAWSITPNNTSQFLVGFDADDFATVSTTGCNIIKFGEVNTTPGVASGRGYFVNFTSFITIGDNTVKTFVHFPKGSYNFDQPITTTDSTYPWNVASQIILVQDNACIQFGNYRIDVDAGYNGCMVTLDQQEASWDARFINTHQNATCIVRLFASNFYHLGRNTTVGNNRGFITIQWQGSVTSLIRDCIFGEGFQFRAFSPNVDIASSKFLNCQYSMSKFNTTPDSLFFMGKAPIANSANTDDAGTPQTIKNCTIKSYGHTPSSASTLADGSGDVQAPKTAGSDNVFLNVSWNRRITHASPASDTFINGATISEQYEFSTTIKDASQVPISGALVILSPLAGNVTAGGIHRVTTTNANGQITPFAVTTQYTDSDGTANSGWTTGILPYWRQISKDTFRARARLPSKLFSSSPIDFSHPTNNGGQPISLNITLLDDVNYTSNGSTVTGVSMTDNRSSPVAWNSKNWGITIVGNLVTNPSLTIQDIYNWWKYYGSQNANVPGTSVNAGIIHDIFNGITETSRGSYYDPTTGVHTGSGVVVDGPTTYAGVRIIDQAGNPFPGVTRMQSDDGSYYIPPITYTLTVTNLIAGSEVRAYTGTSPETAVLIANTESSGTSFGINHSGGNVDGYIVVRKLNYKFFKSLITYGNSSSQLPVSQQADPWYNNP